MSRLIRGSLKAALASSYRVITQARPPLGIPTSHTGFSRRTYSSTGYGFCAKSFVSIQYLESVRPAAIPAPSTPSSSIEPSWNRAPRRAGTNSSITPEDRRWPPGRQPPSVHRVLPRRVGAAADRADHGTGQVRLVRPRFEAVEVAHVDRIGLRVLVHDRHHAVVDRADGVVPAHQRVQLAQ